MTPGEVSLSARVVPPDSAGSATVTTSGGAQRLAGPDDEARPARRRLLRPLRTAASRVMGELESLLAIRRLRRIADGVQPVVAGPWLGEVGFELLYWIPFLTWVVSRFDLDPSRVIAISRGGPETWYRHVSGRYCDVFDYFTREEFRQKNEQRRVAAGEQKQVVVAALDTQILDAAREAVPGGQFNLIHPSVMYGLFKRYWWGHTSTRWIHRHAEFRPFPPPVSPDVLNALPGDYIAVKFYFNDCFPSTPHNRAFLSATMRALSREIPLVSLSTGLVLDEHSGCAEADAVSVRHIQHLVRPRNNLEIQSAVVGHARLFLGTYGGFAYLAPFYGVPSVSIYSEPHGFSRSHLEMAHSVCATLGRRSLHTLDASRADPASVVSHILGAVCS